MTTTTPIEEEFQRLIRSIETHVKSQVKADMETQVKSQVKAEVTHQMEELFKNGRFLPKDLDAAKEQDDAKEPPQDLGAAGLTGLGPKKRNKKKKKKGASNRDSNKRMAGKRTAGAGGLPLPIAIVVLCIAGLLITSNSGDDAPRRLKGIFQVEGGPATDPPPSASIDPNPMENIIETEDASASTARETPRLLQKGRGFKSSTATSHHDAHRLIQDRNIFGNFPTAPPSTTLDTSSPTTVSIDTTNNDSPTKTNSPATCFPVGDRYPDCCVLRPDLIGNGVCNFRYKNMKECGYDGGDCPAPEPDDLQTTDSPSSAAADTASLLTPMPSDGDWQPTGISTGSQTSNYPTDLTSSSNAQTESSPSTPVCPDGLWSVDGYPGCCVEIPEYIGDGNCDGGAYMTEECKFDGEDCEPPFINDTYPICPYGYHQVDGYPGCCVENPDNVGDGKCDGGAYMTEECGLDGGDCTPCLDANPEQCGCGGSVNQADYRGTINFTKSGYDCERWDADWIAVVYLGDIFQDYPNAGLENNNYCRNPSGDDRAYCFLKEEHHEEAGFFEVCNVPYCMAPPASCKESSSEDDGASKELMNATCKYHQCVKNSTGHQPSDTFLAPLQDEVDPACRCAYEVWNCKHGNEDCGDSYKCCADEANEAKSNGMPPGLSDSCECVTKQNCIEGDSEKCHDYAEMCCGEDDYECQSEYSTKPCELELASRQDGANVTTSFCSLNATDAICGDKSDFFGCRCDIWDPLCSSFPNVEVTILPFQSLSVPATSCLLAASNCCNNDNCYCDYLTHATSVLGFDRSYGSKEIFCTLANEIESNIALEVESLESIYNETGGNNWLKNDGWLDGSDHCSWFGISCDSDGHVTKIEMSGNNMVGSFPADSIASFYKLQSLDLSSNNLSGTMAGAGPDGPVTSIFFNLRDLVRVDLSQNQLSGEVDILFAPSLEYVNFSHNNFTSLDTFKPFKKSQGTLVTADTSHNSIRQNIGAMLKNVPAQLEVLYLSHNFIQGTMPVTSQGSKRLQKLYIDSNRLSGSLPDFSSMFPNLRELDLSKQKQTDNGGLTGTIPDSFADLSFLSSMNLTNNQLSGTIPPFLAGLARLQKLDLSDNMLTNTIPIVLGKLGGVLEILDLSSNKLTGSIPAELSSLKDALIHLGNNPEILAPAPLELCFFPGFDLNGNDSFCPVERNALKIFYDSAKGNEWTNSTHWSDPFLSHCEWHGVDCKGSNSTIELELKNNGLSGTLSSSIANLSSIEYLNLADNNIMGSIPSEIGLLSHLSYMRLSHNGFVGNAPVELGNLQKLKLIQLNGNRISGTIPKIEVLPKESSSFVADCGSPSDFDETLECPNCTMCCNANGDCLPQEETKVQKWGFDDYMHLSWVFFALLLLACFVLAVVVFAYEKYWRDNHQHSLHRQTTTEMYANYAVETIGYQSVYRFLVGDSTWGWFIALITMSAQIGILFVFVKGSEKELSSDSTALVYTWKCPRDVDICDDTYDVEIYGWCVFWVLMSLFLLKDIISGVKMVILSAKPRHDLNYRVRFFGGGMLLSAVTLFSLFVSTIYNYAIATSNTGIIVNSVVILFICEIDERFYGVLMAINPRWVDQFSAVSAGENNGGSDIENNNPDRVQGLERQVALLTEQYETVLKMLEDLLSNTQAE